jgi:hypothetical protein
MTDRVAELAYRRQRRYIFVITLVVVIALVALCVLMA